MLYDGDDKRIKAFKRLIELGVFIPLSSVDLYHGRAGTAGENWRVSSNFDNGNNAVVEQSVNKISVLNVANKDIAQAYAEEGAEHQSEAKPEIYKIQSIDPYAVVVDLTKSDLFASEEVKSLIADLAYPSVSKSAVKISFRDKDIYSKVADELITRQLFATAVSDDNIKSLVESLGYGKREGRIAQDIVKAINSHMFLMQKLESAMSSYLSDDLSFEGSSGDLYTMSSEYFSSFFAENHIVGLCPLADSTSPNKTGEYQLFDFKKINTEKEVGERLRYAVDVYSKASNLLIDGISESTRQLLTNTPENIINSVIQKSSTLKEQFEGGVGLWEGFKLGEHTETVMRFFADNFADVLPNETRMVMNYTILCHDIGKAECVKLGIERGTPEERDTYKKYAKILGKTIDVQPELCDFIEDFIFESQKWTSAYYINNDDSALQSLLETCKELLVKYNLEFDDNIVNGLMQMARILQTCDSGAYTLYGKTRRWDTMNYYNNGNYSWTQGFVETEFGYRFKKDVSINPNTKREELGL